MSTVTPRPENLLHRLLQDGYDDAVRGTEGPRLPHDQRRQARQLSGCRRRRNPAAARWRQETTGCRRSICSTRSPITRISICGARCTRSFPMPATSSRSATRGSGSKAASGSIAIVASGRCGCGCSASMPIRRRARRAGRPGWTLIARTTRRCALISHTRRGQFLELNIIREPRWDELCDFLRVPVPDKPLPHANPTEADSLWRPAWRRLRRALGVEHDLPDD